MPIDPRHILLVDDEPDVREALSEMLGGQSGDALACGISRGFGDRA